MSQVSRKKIYRDSYFSRDIVEIEYSGNSFKMPLLLADRYKVTGVLDVGGTGIIYTAEDTSFFNKSVLIKTSKYKPSLFKYKNDEHRIREIKRQRKIMDRERKAFLHAWQRKIAEIPTLLDTVKDINPNLYGPHWDEEREEEFYIIDENLIKKEPYLILTYIEGDILNNSIQGKCRNPEGFARTLIYRFAKILREFHKAVSIEEIGAKVSMVYIDLKPENIICSRGGGFVLIDLGSFFFIIDDKDDKKIYSKQLLCTKGYSAPELFEGANKLEKFTPAVDVYALGATVYEVLTGESPTVYTRGETFDFDFEKVRRYGQEWVEHLQKMLAYSKQDRYCNMTEVLENTP